MIRPLRAMAGAVGRFDVETAGQMTVEWSLVLAAVALPCYFICRVCLRLLVAYYQMVTFLESLPFP